MTTKTTVIHHSADYDGIFCREIAKKFLPDAELIGWDFADKPLSFPEEGMVYVLDLPIDKTFGHPLDRIEWDKKTLYRLVWIDHHKSAIESHPDLLGYRIDGVAACRLAWYWFTNVGPDNPMSDPVLAKKQDFIDRKVSEPLAVRLAGEYDIWDKRDPDAEVFQFGLRAMNIDPVWPTLLSDYGDGVVSDLLSKGRFVQSYQQKNDAGTVAKNSFLCEWEGLKFLTLNTTRFNSLTFASKDVPETGHDALMGFNWNGKLWTVSLYHANHRKDLDLSLIAVKNGGGGHRGACGFTCQKLPFLNT